MALFVNHILPIWGILRFLAIYYASTQVLSSARQFSHYSINYKWILRVYLLCSISFAIKNYEKPYKIFITKCYQITQFSGSWTRVFVKRYYHLRVFLKIFAFARFCPHLTSLSGHNGSTPLGCRSIVFLTNLYRWHDLWNIMFESPGKEREDV